jgi:hypothetical protein
MIDGKIQQPISVEFSSRSLRILCVRCGKIIQHFKNIVLKKVTLPTTLPAAASSTIQQITE